MKTIVFGCLKGGTGKTTICYNIAYTISLSGSRVLVCDFDYTQNNLSNLFNIDLSDYSTDKFLNGQLFKLSNNLFVLPTNPQCAELEYKISTQLVKHQFIYQTVIQQFNSNFDYCLVDLSPSFSNFALNAYAFADIIASVVTPDYLSYQSLLATIAITNEIKSAINPKLKQVGIINKYLSNRTTIEKFTTEIKNIIKCSPFPIPDKELLRRATSLKKPVHTFYHQDYKLLKDLFQETTNFLIKELEE
ncbi:MAG: ParA family protein [Candidatus Woesearchaeota archaeon]